MNAPIPTDRRVVRKDFEGLRRLAWVLDDLVRIPGTNIRFGLDALLGLMPAGGDVAGGAVSAYTIIRAAGLGAGPAVLVRMGMNVLIDTMVGAVPLLGDLFDFGWKANRRNIALLDRYVAEPAPIQRSSRLVLTAVLAVLFLVLALAAWGSVSLLRWLIGLF
ncbi:MAG TPA: DUF4112 domain-containing protein [Longimicrobiales bacterium]